jgi:hypothetical protein
MKIVINSQKNQTQSDKKEKPVWVFALLTRKWKTITVTRTSKMKNKNSNDFESKLRVFCWRWVCYCGGRWHWEEGKFCFELIVKQRIFKTRLVCCESFVFLLSRFMIEDAWTNDTSVCLHAHFKQIILDSISIHQAVLTANYSAVNGL